MSSLDNFLPLCSTPFIQGFLNLFLCFPSFLPYPLYLSLTVMNSSTKKCHKCMDSLGKGEKIMSFSSNFSPYSFELKVRTKSLLKELF